MIINGENLKSFAKSNGIDAIGWFKGAEFTQYLKIIKEHKAIYDFQYRSYENFLQAGIMAKEYKTIIVIIKDYFYESVCEKEGFKLSNYSRFCWQTINPKTELVISYLEDNRYIAHKINAPDRAAACKAGLGFIGKNSLFYAYGLGSYVGIGTIGTNLELQAERVAEESVKNEKCLACNRCIKACPTHAIHENGYGINPLRCISYINRHAEEPNKIVPDDIKKADNWLHGCEICQACCQLNKDMVHNKDVIHSESINLYGMKVNNKSVINRNEIVSKIDEIEDPKYKKYINSLIT